MKTLTIIFSLAAYILLANPPGFSQHINWSRSYGFAYHDNANCVRLTAEGNYLIAGNTYTPDSIGWNVIIMEVGTNGWTNWLSNFGTAGDDIAESAEPTMDGGVVVGLNGFTNLLVLDEFGDSIWTRNYNMNVRHVYQTDDGGYIIVGDGDYNLIKTDEFGDTIWTGNFDMSAHSVKQTPDRGYIVVGRVGQFSWERDFHAVKTDQDGNVMWTKTYGMQWEDGARYVLCTPDGGYLIVGYLEWIEDFDGDIYAIKTDSIGDTIWTGVYGGGLFETVREADITPEGDYILCGSTRSFRDNFIDVYILKIDANGELIWDQAYGQNADYFDDSGQSITITPDGEYLAIGSYGSSGGSNSHIWLMKLDSSYPTTPLSIGGNPMRENLDVNRGDVFRYEGLVTNTADTAATADIWVTIRYEDEYTVVTDQYSDIHLHYSTSSRSFPIYQYVSTQAEFGRYRNTLYIGTFDSDILDSAYFYFDVVDDSTGNYYGNAWLTEGWMKGDFARDTAEADVPATFSISGNYPNPFNANTAIGFSLAKPDQVKVSIYNLKGQILETIANRYFEAGNHKVVWNAQNYASGIYFYRLDAGDFVETRKMVLIR
ncbi:MAG: T9SS type A sorting domain-containing protein [candidate division Zixibacteria bacterium]|nr:T9SS type A sorting domain-containing protein [candidate division Zixibacteria bacterium]